MPVRTDADLVKGILCLDYDTKRLPDLQPFIDTASSIVDDLETMCVNEGSPLSSNKLELIERWLSAHGYCCTDQPYAMRKTGNASGMFQGQTGKRLESTKYGQMALTLDPSGNLDTLNNNNRIRFSWLGKTEQDQLTYYDRNGVGNW